MKTEIINSYKPREGYFINAVLYLTEDQIAIFSSKYKDVSYLDIISREKKISTFDLSTISGIDTSNYYKCYFNLGEKFGLIHRAEELLIFNSENLNDNEIVKISNPFPEDTHERKTNAERASTFLIDNKILFGLADFTCYGFPPRYLCYLEIKSSKSSLGFGKVKTSANWQKLFQLPKENFPKTEFGKFDSGSDWLNIRALANLENRILVHSTGGSSTRLKSGRTFEFNVIAEFDSNYIWKKNFEIEKGIGKFNSDKKYFILHSNEKKNKLLFYDTHEFNIEFDLSLTGKQNLGNEKAISIEADIIGENVIIYNPRFLNICRLIN